MTFPAFPISNSNEKCFKKYVVPRRDLISFTFTQLDCRVAASLKCHGLYSIHVVRYSEWHNRAKKALFHTCQSCRCPARASLTTINRFHDWMEFTQRPADLNRRVSCSLMDSVIIDFFFALCCCFCHDNFRSLFCFRRFIRDTCCTIENVRFAQRRFRLFPDQQRTRRSHCCIVNRQTNVV